MTIVEEVTAFRSLQPDDILDAVESLGYRCDGHLLALNSYENRVYQVGVEHAAPLVSKFYRPQRWTDAAIQEEHDFSRELAELEIPVVPPLQDEQRSTRTSPWMVGSYGILRVITVFDARLSTV